MFRRWQRRKKSKAKTDEDDFARCILSEWQITIKKMVQLHVTSQFEKTTSIAMGRDILHCYAHCTTFQIIGNFLENWSRGNCILNGSKSNETMALRSYNFIIIIKPGPGVMSNSRKHPLHTHTHTHLYPKMLKISTKITTHH